MNQSDADLQKLELLGQMTAAILHDIQSPIAYIDSNNRHLIKKLNKQLADHPEKNSIVEILEENETGLEQIKSLLENIKMFVKKDVNKKTCFLQDLIESSLKITTPQALDKVEILFKRQNLNDTIMAVPSQITQVIINLIINAIEAFETHQKQSQIKLHLQSHNQQILLTVSDNASGIPAEKINCIFDWYVSTKEKGSGQGLAICKQIIEEHGGHISCSSEQGKGSRFTISLPKVDQ